MTQLTSTFNSLKATLQLRNTKNSHLGNLWSKEYYGRSIQRSHVVKSRPWRLVLSWLNRLMLSSHFL